MSTEAVNESRMTKQEALKMTMPFGKYSGWTLGEIYTENRKYLEWLYGEIDADRHPKVFDALSELV